MCRAVTSKRCLWASSLTKTNNLLPRSRRCRRTASTLEAREASLWKISRKLSWHPNKSPPPIMSYSDNYQPKQISPKTSKVMPRITLHNQLRSRTWYRKNIRLSLMSSLEIIREMKAKRRSSSSWTNSSSKSKLRYQRLLRSMLLRSNRMSAKDSIHWLRS